MNEEKETYVWKIYAYTSKTEGKQYVGISKNPKKRARYGWGFDILTLLKHG